MIYMIMLSWLTFSSAEVMPVNLVQLPMSESECIGRLRALDRNADGQIDANEGLAFQEQPRASNPSLDTKSGITRDQFLVECMQGKYVGFGL
jgi:hypothetical protein